MPDWPPHTALFKHGVPTITSISPAGGSAEGNITVLLGGTAFRNFGDVKVRFCSVDVRGYVLSEEAITCIVPPLSALPRLPNFRPSPLLSKACRVDISLNGVHFTTSNTVFWYYNLSAVSIARMSPSGGPVAGGTPVMLDGVGFVDHGGGVQGAKCRFGDVVVPATIIAHDKAQCVSPPTLAAPVPVTAGSQ